MINIDKLTERILNGYDINFSQAIDLANYNDKNKLYEYADKIRRFFKGNEFKFCSITNAKSGRCPEDCKWCSQSVFHNTKIEIYDIINKSTLIKHIEEAEKYGIHRHSLVTSGKKVSDKKLDELIELYEIIKNRSEVGLCASMGLLNENQLRKLKNVGVEYYHCNLETAESYFDKLCSTHTYAEKIHTIKMAQKLGFEVCSGGIIGMGETMTQRIELAFTLKNLGIMSIPINILMQIKGTPLENMPDLDKDEIFTTIAVFRFINPEADIRLAGGRIKIRNYRDTTLKCGLNAFMTGNYLTTSGVTVSEDIENIKKAGFELATIR